MTTEQIYTVVNSAASQALGQSAVTAIDTASFVSLHKKGEREEK